MLPGTGEVIRCPEYFLGPQNNGEKLGVPDGSWVGGTDFGSSDGSVEPILKS